MTVSEDGVVPVPASNQEMGDAIDQARSSISEFFKAFEDPQPNQAGFAIKARFQDGDEVEHIWLSDLDFGTHPATGVVGNEPRINSISYMERVPFLPDQISDWMYLEDGCLIGGFTTKVLIRNLKAGGWIGKLKQALRTM